MNVLYTTYVKAGDGEVYDLGKGEHVPFHNHARGGSCNGCLTINAWTGLRQMINWPVVFNTVSYCLAAVFSVKAGHPIMAFVWLCYGLSCFGLVAVEKGLD